MGVYDGSLAFSGAGAQLSIGPIARFGITGSFTPILELTTQPWKPQQWDKLEVSNFNSLKSRKEFIKGMADSGTIGIQGNSVSSDPGQIALRAAFEDGSNPYQFQLTMPPQPGQIGGGDRYTFKGLVMSLTPLGDLAPNRPVGLQGEIQITGPIQYVPSGFVVNAGGAVQLFAGHPLGNPAWYTLWSTFALVPGVTLPVDAVIQGIYPAMVASNNSNAIPENRFGVALVPWFGGVGTALIAPSAPYANVELIGASIGTTLAALSGQQMLISLGATLASPFAGTLSVSALGFAIYYTSATPLIDPTIPPPFSVPSGQGLSWAVPFTVTFGPIEPGESNGSATGTAAQVSL